MNKNLILVLIFFLVLVGLFWLMPNQKVEIIGVFFEKIVTPLSLPLSAIVLTWLGFYKLKKIKQKRDD